MVDPISTGASAVTLVDRIAAAGGWLWHRLSRRSRERPEEEPNQGLEIRPMSYRVDLTGRVPRVEIRLWAINYLAKPLSLRDVKISRFGGGRVALDNIPLAQEVTLRPRSSSLVYCERALADSEARAVQAETAYHAFTGALNLVARAVSRGKEITFRATAQVVEGSVNLDPALRPSGRAE